MSSEKEIVVATQGDGGVKVIFTGNDSNGLPRGMIVTEAANGARVVVGTDVLLHALLTPRSQGPSDWNMLVGLDELGTQKQHVDKKITTKLVSASDMNVVVAAAKRKSTKSPCWTGYKQVGMKKGKNGNMVPNCVPVDASVAEFAKAPKKDRISGSKKNKKKSASGGKKIVFSATVEASLRKKMQAHNEKAPKGRRATMGQLKAAYRRGAGAFSSSHRPGMGRAQWAMARVNAYLKLLKSGRPSNPNYKQDNDLLPASHPRSSKSASIIAGGSPVIDESMVFLQDSVDDYMSPEHALVAFAEYSGLGYESVPAFRAAWLRAVERGLDPFDRAKVLAIDLYTSPDADLLPRYRDRT